MLRLTAARSILLRLTAVRKTCIAPSSIPDRSAIPQKSATLSKVGICCGSQPQGRNLLRLTAARSEFAAAHSRKVDFATAHSRPQNLYSTIVHSRPFRYPSKIRNVIKGRNLRRLTAARSEFAAAHSRLTICIAPSLNPDRSAIPQKSATFSNCKSAAHFRPPSTQLKPIFTFLKGEFEAAHSRKVGIYCSFQLQLFG